MSCPDYCTAIRDGRPFCILRNGCPPAGREPCPVDHSDRAWWKNTTEFEFGALIKRNHAVDYKVRCTLCGRESLCVNKGEREELWATGLKVTWSRMAVSEESCSVTGCEATDLEMHHFAPRNTFPDADDWPYLPLCRTHHRHWHRTMDGYRWNRKGSQLNTENNNQLKQERESA